MEEPKEPIFEAEEQKGALFKAILSLQRVRVSAYLSIIDCCARNCLRGRRQKILKKLNRRYHTQLDIRSIIANQIAFTDFIRCFLSKPQLALLALQRTRTASIDSDDVQDSDEDEPLGKFNFKRFEQTLVGFEPQNQLERKLVQGVLFYKGDQNQFKLSKGKTDPFEVELNKKEELEHPELHRKNQVTHSDIESMPHTPASTTLLVTH